MVLRIVDITGLKKSGKTTVLENIVKRLCSKGYKVGTLKKIHIPDFTIDQPGKDTYRHKQAGAEFVISLAPSELALIKNKQDNLPFSELQRLIPEDTDFLICEELNEKRDDIAYIITLESLDALEETLRVRNIGENILGISGVVTNVISHHDNYQVFNATTDDGIEKLVQRILEYIPE